MVALPHDRDCDDLHDPQPDVVLRTLAHTATHPNVGAVLFLDSSADGRSRLAAHLETLGHDRPLYPQVQAPTRRASFLEHGASSEVVFHRYAFELGAFIPANSAFDPAAIREIRFVFDANPKGVVVIDDVGFAEVVR